MDQDYDAVGKRIQVCKYCMRGRKRGEGREEWRESDRGKGGGRREEGGRREGGRD